MWQILPWQTSAQGGMNNMEDLNKILSEVVRKNLKFFCIIILIAFVLFAMAMIFLFNYNSSSLKEK